MAFPFLGALGTAASFASGMGSLMSGVSGLFGGGDDDASHEARKNFAFQHKYALEDLKYGDSRKVEALKFAGLNPALAYGGFGGPTSSLPQEPGLVMPPDWKGNRINSAREASLALAQIQKLKADTAASESVADLNRATAIRTGVQTQIDSSNAGIASINLDKEKFLRDTFDSFHVAGKELDAKRATAIYNQVKASNDNDALWALNRVAKSLGYVNFEEGIKSVDFRHKIQELALQAYSMPKASAEHDFYLTTFGKSIAPYLNSAESISRTVKPFSR